MITVQIRPPQIPAGAVSNVLGLAGLLLLAVCLGALFGNWWVTGLVISLEMLGMSWVAHTYQRAAAAAQRQVQEPVRPPLKVAA